MILAAAIIFRDRCVAQGGIRPASDAGGDILPDLITPQLVVGTLKAHGVGGEGSPRSDLEQSKMRQTVSGKYCLENTSSTQLKPGLSAGLQLHFRHLID